MKFAVQLLERMFENRLKVRKNLDCGMNSKLHGIQALVYKVKEKVRMIIFLQLLFFADYKIKSNSICELSYTYVDTVDRISQTYKPELP